MSMFTVTPNGVITIDTSDVRSDFETAYKEALGADLNLDSSTPQGQMIINDTSTLVAAQQEVVKAANNCSVYYATGHALDVAASFWGYYRKKATGTVVVVKFTGTNGTVIPAGTLVTDGTYEYATLNGATIPASGTISVQCQCTTTGPIECQAGAITDQVIPIAGISTVTNQSNGIVGYDAESDNAFRARITANWFNIRARAILGAIVDNVAQIQGVLSCVGMENPTGSSVTKNGVTMPAHSVYLAIVGGEEEAIARVIAQQKTVGAETVGNTVVSYIDDTVGYQYSYNIERPTPVNVDVKVQYSENQYTKPDTATQVEAIITQWFSDVPAQIGQTVSGGVIAQALADFPQIDLLAVKVSTDGGTTWVDYITTDYTEVAVLNSVTTETV